jgi:hypothetical protein
MEIEKNYFNGSYIFPIENLMGISQHFLPLGSKADKTSENFRKMKVAVD